MEPTYVRPDSDPLRAPPATSRRHEVARILVIVIVIALAILFAAGSWVLVLWSAPGHTEPSQFAPVGVERVAAGSIGCRSTSDEVCYAAIFESALSGLTLGHLQFVVANASAGATTNGPVAPPLPLGAAAEVSALASPTSVAGVWNVSNNRWVSGGDWPVPNGPNVTVVLDTGLVSNYTLMDAEFDIVLTSPYEGAVGFFLFCGGC
jgi:hypothetical protein